MSDNEYMRLRLPPTLKKQVAEAARGANRSMNAEIVSRLEESFDGKLHDQLVDTIIRMENILAVTAKQQADVREVSQSIARMRAQLEQALEQAGVLKADD